MLKFYREKAITYYNNVEVGQSAQAISLCDEIEANSVRCIKHITWDNIDEIDSWILAEGSFDLLNTKKGRILHLYNKIRKIKEWKTPLNISIEIVLEEFIPSSREVSKWYDIKKATQYLREQNLV